MHTSMMRHAGAMLGIMFSGISAAALGLASAVPLIEDTSPTFRDGHRIGPGKRGLHYYWSRVTGGRAHQGGREIARRRRQIAAGSLTVSNGLVLPRAELALAA